MLYQTFLNKAISVTIEEADNGLAYLEPTWRLILQDNNLNIDEVSDYKANWSEVEDVLKLEIEKRNTVNSLKPYILNWVHDLITASVEPAIIQKETEYIKNLTEYLKANKQPVLKDEEWDRFRHS